MVVDAGSVGATIVHIGKRLANIEHHIVGGREQWHGDSGQPIAQVEEPNGELQALAALKEHIVVAAACHFSRAPRRAVANRSPSNGLAKTLLNDACA